MPILSIDLASHLWRGATRPRGLDSFALTYGTTFAVMGSAVGQSSSAPGLNSDPVRTHEGRYF